MCLNNIKVPTDLRVSLIIDIYKRKEQIKVSTQTIELLVWLGIL